MSDRNSIHSITCYVFFSRRKKVNNKDLKAFQSLCFLSWPLFKSKKISLCFRRVISLYMTMKTNYILKIFYSYHFLRILFYTCASTQSDFVCWKVYKEWRYYIQSLKKKIDLRFTKKLNLYSFFIQNKICYLYICFYVVYT